MEAMDYNKENTEFLIEELTEKLIARGDIAEAAAEVGQSVEDAAYEVARSAFSVSRDYGIRMLEEA